MHADPHPGNVLVTDDGRLALVDLGMVKDIVLDDAHIGATIVLTTAGCPLRNQIRADAEQADRRAPEADRERRLAVSEVERVVAGRCKTVPVHHVGGTVHNPEAILSKILEAVR